MNTFEVMKQKINNQLKQQQEKLKPKEIIDDRQAFDSRINWRVTEEEKNLIKDMAKLQHMDVSTFLRQLVFNWYINDYIKN
ncbi:DUF6290 family protein [Clostridium culturomicium]|uniref:DUF6290 family protein n=1 Tax=Clostridium culturomicium TaxID=1499683 RepID=UPI00058C92B1|nr:DUF6290 family protein [Clostridium culturomicium]